VLSLFNRLQTSMKALCELYSQNKKAETDRRNIEFKDYLATTRRDWLQKLYRWRQEAENKFVSLETLRRLDAAVGKAVDSVKVPRWYPWKTGGLAKTFASWISARVEHCIRSNFDEAIRLYADKVERELAISFDDLRSRLRGIGLNVHEVLAWESLKPSPDDLSDALGPSLGDILAILFVPTVAFVKVVLGHNREADVRRDVKELVSRLFSEDKLRQVWNKATNVGLVSTTDTLIWEGLDRDGRQVKISDGQLYPGLTALLTEAFEVSLKQEAGFR